MPRRTHTRRRTRRATPPPALEDRTLTYEQMARALVKAGRRSVAILDHPHRFTTTTEGTEA